jgi:carotenoid cleavage dioxygenase-like enzyme
VIHDFAATARHLVFLLGPARLSIARALLGEARPERLVHWQAKLGGEALIVPIDDVARAARLPIEPFFVWHFANAFERRDEIVVDYVHHADVSATGTMRDAAARAGGAIDMDEGELRRATIDPRAGRVPRARVGDEVRVSPRRLAR